MNERPSLKLRAELLVLPGLEDPVMPDVIDLLGNGNAAPCVDGHDICGFLLTQHVPPSGLQHPASAAGETRSPVTPCCSRCSSTFQSTSKERTKTTVSLVVTRSVGSMPAVSSSSAI